MDCHYSLCFLLVWPPVTPQATYADMPRAESGPVECVQEALPGYIDQLFYSHRSPCLLAPLPVRSCCFASFIRDWWQSQTDVQFISYLCDKPTHAHLYICTITDYYYYYYYFFFFSPTCFGNVCDHHQGVPQQCHAIKGLECVFPIWFTQCSHVWFTRAVPMTCSDHAVLLKKILCWILCCLRSEKKTFQMLSKIQQTWPTLYIYIYIYSFLPSKSVQAVTFLHYMREVTGSNSEPDID